MTGITRPTGEQLRFESALTGSHVLDDYLEDAEVGGRTLADLMGDLFDSATGSFVPFTHRGTYANGTAFNKGDLARTTAATDLSAVPATYCCVVAYTSAVSMNADIANWRLVAKDGDVGATGSTGSTGATGATGAAGTTPTITTTSTTSRTIGAGSFAFTTAAALTAAIGTPLTFTSRANSANFLSGAVTAIAGTSVTILVGANDYGGSGTLADWDVSISGFRGIIGATGATGPTGSPGAASESAAGIVELNTDGETVTGTDDTRATHAKGVKAAITAAIAAIPAPSAFTVRTTTDTAVAGERLLADVTASAWTMTLPATPAAGDSFELKTYGNYNLTIGRNGSKISGISDDGLIPGGSNVHVKFTYLNSTYGWVYGGAL